SAFRRLRAGCGHRAPVGWAGARRPCRDGNGDAPAGCARLPPLALHAACRGPSLLAADGSAEGDPALPRRSGRRLVADGPGRFHADACQACSKGRNGLEEKLVMQKSIDSHFHIWRQKDQPWLVGPMVPRIFGPYEPIRRDYPIEEFLADQKGSGVEKAVYVQTNWAKEDFENEVAFLTDTAKASGWPH